jgi:ABC-type multidrug transport system fused ATPase/permease subunit
MVYVHRGDITIGGVSIYALPIDRARRHFAVIPQDPYLFAGSLQSALDPYGRHSEEACTAALSTVALPLSLEYQLQEGGENLSRGERQLMCLARTLLDPAPFIIMDEPTSGIDSISDAQMQQVIRTHLADRTVITIAHRVNTLLDYDLVFEIEDGVLKRYGKPDELLSEP